MSMRLEGEEEMAVLKRMSWSAHFVTSQGTKQIVLKIVRVWGGRCAKAGVLGELSRELLSVFRR
jgi:hypothetical protein